MCTKINNPFNFEYETTLNYNISNNRFRLKTNKYLFIRKCL